jgi:NADH/F420H2 dehydrogenase subunit C
MNSNNKEMSQLENVLLVFPEVKISSSYDLHDSETHTVLTVPPHLLTKVLEFLRDDSTSQYKTLISICGADFPQYKKRFLVNYHLLSVHFVHRLNVQVWVEDGESLDTAVGLYKSAGWYEREVYDMFGVFFTEHPDMRRILSDYGFQGHPLRRDFPLTGFYETRYDEAEKRIITENVEFAQEFRSFDFTSPWDQTSRPNIIRKK